MSAWAKSAKISSHENFYLYSTQYIFVNSLYSFKRVWNSIKYLELNKPRI